MSEYTFWFKDDTIGVTISNVQVFGSFRPATFDDPAEYPELDGYDMQVCVYDEDGNESVLSEYHGEELIESLGLRNKLEDMLWSEMESQRDEDF